MIHVRTLVKSLRPKPPKTPADLIATINADPANQQEYAYEDYPGMADAAWREEFFRLAREEGYGDFGICGWASLGFTSQPTHYQLLRVAKTGRHRLISRIPYRGGAAAPA